MRRGAPVARLVVLLVLVAGVVLSGVRGGPAAAQNDPRFFAESGFLVDNDLIWSFFSTHGGTRAFGLPISRTFRLHGRPTQIFQRHVLRVTDTNAVHVVSLLDSGWLPSSQIAGAIVPPYDPGVTGGAPPSDSAAYVDEMLAFVRASLPDQVEGYPTNFFQTFATTIAPLDLSAPDSIEHSIAILQNLNVWGIPTSRPQRDGGRVGVYLVRLERGVLRFDAGCRCTTPLPLGAYFRAMLTGNDLPADLERQAPDSPYLRQYDLPTHSGPYRASALPDTDLSYAFLPSLEQPSVTALASSNEPSIAPTSTPVGWSPPTATPLPVAAAPSGPATKNSAPPPPPAPAPINRPPYTFVLQLKEAGPETTEMMVKTGEDERSLWQFVRYERDRLPETSGHGPNIIQNKIYVARNERLARDIYGEEVAVKNFPEAVDRYGAIFYIEHKRLGEQSQVMASCLEEGCNAPDYNIHLRFVYRNKNIVSVMYTYGEQYSASPTQVTFLARHVLDRMK